MTLGERIKMLRTQKDMSQADLAKKLEVSYQFVSLLESGKKGPSHETLLKLASFFNVTTDFLLTGEETITEVKELADDDFEVLYRDFKELTPHDREVIMDLVRARRERLRKEGKIPDDKNNKIKD